MGPGTVLCGTTKQIFPARSGGEVTVLDETKIIWTATLTCWRRAARRVGWMWPVVVCGGA
jgi:hypothetical protein